MNLSRDLVKNVTQASFMLKSQWWSVIRANKTSAEEMVTNAQRDVSSQCAWNVVNATTAIWWHARLDYQASLVPQLQNVTAATGEDFKMTTYGGTVKIATTLYVKFVCPQMIENTIWKTYVLFIA